MGRFERQLVGKCDRRTVRPTIDDVILTGDRVENWLRPWLTVKFGLKPCAAVYRVHKEVRYSDRNIEIREACLIVLGVDKPQYIGMGDAQDAHVRAAPNTALLYDLGRLIDDVHKAHRA